MPLHTVARPLHDRYTTVTGDPLHPLLLYIHGPDKKMIALEAKRLEGKRNGSSDKGGGTPRAGSPGKKAKGKEAAFAPRKGGELECSSKLCAARNGHATAV